MKKILILAAALVGFSANADVAGPAWACSLNGSISGFSASLIGSLTVIQGEGVLSCDPVNSKSVEVPVTIKLVGLGFGLGFTKFENITVVSASAGVANIDDFIGSYNIGPKAGATLIDRGVEVGAQISVKKEGGLSFDVGFAGVQAQGLQAKIELQGFEVTRK